ncbi:conserved membrane protein of unknown function [Streptococcus sanguinis]|uniref:Uncharacterized protein n=1 Tax=Streptococcus sanguinis TaxID=1305 RepID=A0A0B7GS48_STRSA|nr:conserved membrane protein of unknown function [Streptococcus sanguinis]
MKSIKGITLIAVSIILTIYTWASAGMTNFIVPGLALTTLSLTFLLATRNALLEIVGKIQKKPFKIRLFRYFYIFW